MCCHKTLQLTYTGRGHVNGTDSDENTEKTLMDACFGGQKYMCAHIHTHKHNEVSVAEADS